MNVSTPFFFPVLPPHLVPAMRLVRSGVGASLLAAMADHAPRAATMRHTDAATALQALCDRLPACDMTFAPRTASAMLPVAEPLLAEDAAHDRYFRVCRVPECEGKAFPRSIIMAAARFHAEMTSAYSALDAQRFAAMGSGFAALLGHLPGFASRPSNTLWPSRPSCPKRSIPCGAGCLATRSLRR